MDKTIADTLIIQAIKQAILNRRPSKGLIVHSDRGSQYAGNDFKVELIHRMRFATREQAKRMIFEYIVMYYNCKRAHSTLGYLSPLEYEKRQAICLN